MTSSTDLQAADDKHASYLRPLEMASQFETPRHGKLPDDAAQAECVKPAWSCYDICPQFSYPLHIALAYLYAHVKNNPGT